MNFLKCTTDKYDVLYQKWVDADPGRLLDLASFDPLEDRLLDLCGGTGAVSKEALNRANKANGLGPFPVLMDLNPRCDLLGVYTRKGDVQSINSYIDLPQCNVVVIRQAMAYLNPRKVAQALSTSCILTKRARIAFNLFATPKWGKKAYDYKGHKYFEASGFIGNVVGHIQACKGFGFDVSVFKYMDPKEVVEQMKFAFDLKEFVTDGRSVRILMQSC